MSSGPASASADQGHGPAGVRQEHPCDEGRRSHQPGATQIANFDLRDWALGYSKGVSLEQIEASILELSPEERRRFAAWYDKHRKDLLPEQQEEDDLADEQRAEILRRRDLALAHPDLLEPWDGTIKRARQAA